MPKLSKNMYITSKGEKKLNCYNIAIPKEIIKKANIKEDEQLMIYSEEHRIIIEVAISKLK